MRALMRVRPGTRRRTRMRAAMIPKTVLSGTAIAAIRIVRYRACRASGLVTDSQNTSNPWSNEYQTTSETGSTSRNSR